MTADGRCNDSLLADHCQDLLNRGCEGILLFGTSGEGASFSVAERLAALRAVIGAAGKSRDVDVEELLRMLQRQDLSDREAEFYKEFPAAPQSSENE